MLIKRGSAGAALSVGQTLPRSVYGVTQGPKSPSVTAVCAGGVGRLPGHPGDLLSPAELNPLVLKTNLPAPAEL